MTRSAGGARGSGEPLLWNDLDRSIQSRVGVLSDLRSQGPILRAVAGLAAALRERG